MRVPFSDRITASDTPDVASGSSGIKLTANSSGLKLSGSVASVMA
jgi:hypothetical protein